MKTIKLLFLFLCFTVINCYSQLITVVDIEDQKPVPDVAVLNESNTKFVYTNRSGVADISSFSPTENICFQHFTYERICISHEEIISEGNIIFLTRKSICLRRFCNIGQQMGAKQE